MLLVNGRLLLHKAICQQALPNLCFQVGNSNVPVGATQVCLQGTLLGQADCNVVLGTNGLEVKFMGTFGANVAVGLWQEICVVDKTTGKALFRSLVDYDKKAGVEQSYEFAFRISLLGE